MEQWKEVRGHPDYEINNYGKVRNKETLVSLKPRLNRNGGYLRVRLDGKECCIHRLVFETFFDTDTTNVKIKHLDGDHFNNHLGNLDIR